MDIFLILVYIAVSIVAIIRCQTFSRIDQLLLGGLGFLLILSCAFKSVEEVADAEGYVEGFYATSVNERIEPLSTLFFNISKQIFDTPVGMFFFFALVAISIRVLGIIKNAAFIWASVAIYLSQIFILHDFIQIRASIASAILLCSIAPLYNRNLKLFLVMGSIATLFHYSAIIMFAFYLFNPTRINKWIYGSVLLVCYSLAFCGLSLGYAAQFIPIPFVQHAFAAYELTMATAGLEINIVSWPQIMRCCIFLFLLFYYKSIILHYKYTTLLLKLYAVGLCSYVIFADIPTFANRISELIFVFEILLFPLIAYAVRPRRIGLLISLFMGFILLLVNIYHFKLVPA